MKHRSIFCHVESDRAAILALIVSELVTMSFTKLLAVAEGLFCALLTQKVLCIHVLTKCSIEVIFASVVHPITRITIVESHFFHHELEGLKFVCFGRLRLQIVLAVDLFGLLLYLLFFGHELRE